MERLTKRTPNGIAYMTIADSLSKREQDIEGSKPILEGIYAMFQKLADYEDMEEQKKEVNKDVLQKWFNMAMKEVSRDCYIDLLKEWEISKSEAEEVEKAIEEMLGIKLLY